MRSEASLIITFEGENKGFCTICRKHKIPTIWIWSSEKQEEREVISSICPNCLIGIMRELTKLFPNSIPNLLTELGLDLTPELLGALEPITQKMINNQI